MRDIYFTDSNISRLSLNIIKKISSKKIEKLRKDINIKDSVLLIIDMQKYFTSKESHAFVPSVISVIKKIKKVQKIFKDNKRPIILTRHIDDLNNNKNMLLKWWNDRIKKDNFLSEIDERVMDDYCIVIEKTQYDAFYKTRLEDILAENRIKKVFITGVVSNLCCETTARVAFVKGYEVYFGVDTTAAYCFPHHMASVMNISYGFGVPFISEDIE